MYLCYSNTHWVKAGITPSNGNLEPPVNLNVHVFGLSWNLMTPSLHFRRWGRRRWWGRWHRLLHMSGWNLRGAQWNRHLWQVWTRCCHHSDWFCLWSSEWDCVIDCVVAGLHLNVLIVFSRLPPAVPHPHHRRLGHWLWWQVAVLRVWALLSPQGTASCIWLKIRNKYEEFQSAPT